MLIDTIEESLNKFITDITSCKIKEQITTKIEDLSNLFVNISIELQGGSDKDLCERVKGWFTNRLTVITEFETFSDEQKLKYLHALLDVVEVIFSSDFNELFCKESCREILKHFMFANNLKLLQKTSKYFGKIISFNLRDFMDEAWDMIKEKPKDSKKPQSAGYNSSLDIYHQLTIVTVYNNTVQETQQVAQQAQQQVQEVAQQPQTEPTAQQVALQLQKQAQQAAQQTQPVQETKQAVQQTQQTVRQAQKQVQQTESGIREAVQQVAKQTQPSKPEAQQVAKEEKLVKNKKAKQEVQNTKPANYVEKNTSRELAIKLFESYVEQVKKDIFKNWKTSKDTVNQTVEMIISINADGSYNGYKILDKTSNESARRAAVAAVNLTAPFAKFPENKNFVYRTVNIPLVFEQKRFRKWVK